MVLEPSATLPGTQGRCQEECTLRLSKAFVLAWENSLRAPLKISCASANEIMEPALVREARKQNVRSKVSVSILDRWTGSFL